MADVMIDESFEVRTQVVATYCTRIYHAKSPESLNAKTTAAERYFHTCLTGVDMSHCCNISEPGDTVGGGVLICCLPSSFDH